MRSPSARTSGSSTAGEAARLRSALGGDAITEKPMFGGICFLLREHMLCAVSKRGFLFRVGKEHYREALARPGARPMVMKGRNFAGYVRVDPGACDSRQLRRWVVLAKRYVAALPPKAKRKPQ